MGYFIKTQKNLFVQETYCWKFLQIPYTQKDIFANSFFWDHA